jgi:phage baseplate assembly protein W
MALYKGFSSIDYKSGTISRGVFPSSNDLKTQSPLTTQLGLEYSGNNTFILTDIPLVERNIINHIYTKMGSRVMMPKFGSIIPDLLFEPLDDDTIFRCKTELERIVNYDPRVKLNGIIMTPLYDSNILSATISLYYVELNATQNMNLNLEFLG